MEKIYSKVEPDKLLHFIMRQNDFEPGRQDLIPPDNGLQCAMLRFDAGKSFKPHRHIWKQRDEIQIAQEIWCVVKGWVRVFYYDLDNELIKTEVIGAGDISCTIEAGHTYEILENDTRVYEMKSTKYRGQEEDKVFI